MISSSSRDIGGHRKRMEGRKEYTFNLCLLSMSLYNGVLSFFLSSAICSSRALSLPYTSSTHTITTIALVMLQPYTQSRIVGIYLCKECPYTIIIPVVRDVMRTSKLC